MKKEIGLFTLMIVTDSKIKMEIYRKNRKYISPKSNSNRTLVPQTDHSTLVVSSMAKRSGVNLSLSYLDHIYEIVLNEEDLLKVFEAAIRNSNSNQSG